jgi:hypothetical protein
MEQAVPTLAHRALVRLRDVGIMKYLVSVCVLRLPSTLCLSHDSF